MTFEPKAILMDESVPGGDLGGGGSSSPAPAPSMGGDISTSIDSLLGIGTSTPTQEEAPAVPSSTPSPQPVVEGQEPVEEAPESDPDDDTETDAAMEDVTKPNLLDLKASRGKRIYAGYKAYKAISEALGRDVNVDDAKRHFEAFSDISAMEADFTSGDPEHVSTFIDHWTKTSPDGMNTLAGVLPDKLAQSNPGAYKALAVPVLSRYINALYSRGQAEQNPELKKALLYTARMAEWDIYGKYKPDTELASQPQPDPNAEREASINSKLSQIQTWEKQQAKQAQDKWAQDLDALNNSKLEQETDNILAPIKANTPARLYNAAKRDFIEAVKEHLAKDVDGDRLYKIERNKALKSGASTAHPTLNAAHMQRASRAIRAIAPGFLKELGVSAKAQSDTRHAALSGAAEAGKAPTSAGAPRSNSIVPGNRQYATKGDQMEGTVDDLLGIPARR